LPNQGPTVCVTTAKQKTARETEKSVRAALFVAA
jgi:hypothetical protein